MPPKRNIVVSQYLLRPYGPADSPARRQPSNMSTCFPLKMMIFQWPLFGVSFCQSNWNGCAFNYWDHFSTSFGIKQNPQTILVQPPPWMVIELPSLKVVNKRSKVSRKTRQEPGAFSLLEQGSIPLWHFMKIWLVNMDPYHGLLKSLYNWVV